MIKTGPIRICQISFRNSDFLHRRLVIANATLATPRRLKKLTGRGSCHDTPEELGLSFRPSIQPYEQPPSRRDSNLFRCMQTKSEGTTRTTTASDMYIVCTEHRITLCSHHAASMHSPDYDSMFTHLGCRCSSYSSVCLRWLWRLGRRSVARILKQRALNSSHERLR